MSLPDGDFSENGNRFVSGMCKPILSLFDITVRQQLIPRPDDLQPPPVNMRCAGTKRVSFSEDDEADRHASFKMPLRIAIVMRTCLRILLTLIYIYILDGNPLSTTKTYPQPLSLLPDVLPCMQTRILQIMHLFIALCSLATFGVAAESSFNCQPGQMCWPTQQQWQQLNQTLDGHLYQTVPLGAPCYNDSSYFNIDICASVQSTYNISLDRVAQYGQTFWGNWEACGTSGCSLLSSNLAINLFPSCSLGTLATYYVDVGDATHISTTLQFSKKHNLRISIKNTGHDFAGRSV
jgi:hypothetical protein